MRHDDGQDREARAPHEHEPVLLLAMDDPLTGRQQRIGEAHLACPSL